MIYYSLLLPLSPPPCLENTIHMRTHTQGHNQKQNFTVSGSILRSQSKAASYQAINPPWQPSQKRDWFFFRRFGPRDTPVATQ